MNNEFASLSDEDVWILQEKGGITDEDDRGSLSYFQCPMGWRQDYQQVASLRSDPRVEFVHEKSNYHLVTPGRDPLVEYLNQPPSKY